MWKCAAFLICLVGFTAHAADNVRTWTDVDGRTIQAQFIREVDGDVTFLKDGKLVTWPLDRLSEKDQKLIRELESDKKVEETAPPAGAPRPELAPPIDDAQTKSAPPLSGSKSSVTNKRAVAETRNWRDRKGKQTSAKFVRIHEENVILSRSGRVVSMLFKDLSRQDQEYIRDLLTARGEASLVPPLTEEVAGPAPAEPFGQPAGEPPAIAPAPSDSLPLTASDPKGGIEFPIRSQEQNQPRESSAPATTAQNNQPSAEQAQAAASTPETEARTIRRRRVIIDSPQQVIGFFIGLPILAAIGSLIAAVILRAATYLVLGGHLPYGDAYATMFLMYIVNGVLGFAFTMLTNHLPDDTAGMLSLATIPVSFLVQAAIIASRLEIDFGSACLISLAMMLIMVVIIVIVCVLVLAMFPGFRPAS